MRNLTIVLFIFFQLTALAQNKVDENYNKIIGEWTLLNRDQRRWVNNQIEITNISPIDTVKVNFNSDYSITLKHSNNGEAKFNVKIKRKKIKIKQISGNKSDKLLEGEFIIVISKDALNLELVYSGPPHDRIFFEK